VTSLSWLVQFQRAGSSFSAALLGGIYSFSAGEGTDDAEDPGDEDGSSAENNSVEDNGEVASSDADTADEPNDEEQTTGGDLVLILKAA